MRRIFPITLLLLLFSLCFARTAIGGSGEITLLFTNDLHADFLPSEPTGDRPSAGGFEALEQIIEGERRKTPASLYLDAGDFMTGTPLSDLEHRGVKGGAIIDFYNFVGLDAMTIGNHEFDHPLANTMALLALADFPVLGANVRDSGGNLFTGKAYEIFEVGDIRVGVIGITTDELGNLIGHPSYEGLRFSTGVETLNELIPEVDRKTDLIVVLSHEGVDTDREIARTVPEIDVIVGGHSHTRIEGGEWVGEVLIVQAGSHGRYLGRVDLQVVDDEVANADCRLIPTLAEGVEGSPEVRALVEGYERRIVQEYGVVIAQATGDLGRGYFSESELGNWVTDRMREITGADVALLNSGGIRKDLRAGPITRLDIQEMFPFANTLCRFTLTGAELLAFALYNTEAAVNESHGILQISGLNYAWQLKPEGITIPFAFVDEDAIDPEKIYTVASVDYVAVAQPEKYLGLLPRDVNMLGGTLASHLLAAVTESGVIEPPRESRMRRVEIDYAPGSRR